MGKLNRAEIDEYFDVHLPYRTRTLLAHYKMTHDSAGQDKPWTSNPAWLDGCFITSLINGRIYLNTLGIGKSGGALVPFVPRQDDVTVDDLGGTVLDPTKLPGAEQTLFLNFVIMADKAAAHFTTPSGHSWNQTHDVIKLIHGYLNTNLYIPAGRSGLEGLP